MASSDAYLVRGVDHVRRFAMDTYDEVRWDDGKIVELLDIANGLVHEEIRAAIDPKSAFRFDISTVIVKDSVEDYAFPGNFRKFRRFVKLTNDGNIEREISPTDPMADLGGLLLFDARRGFRIRPVPKIGADQTWKLYYETGPLPFLVYGTVNVTGTTATNVVLIAPTSDQLGTLSAVDDFYNNSYLHVTEGTGVGQIARITAYVGSDLAATVDTMSTVLDGTSIYEILPTIEQPYDVANFWRAVMMMKAADSDVKHYRAADTEYRSVMRSVLQRMGDNSARYGPSMSESYSDPLSYGMIDEIGF